MVEESANGIWFIFAACSPIIISELIDGKLPVRDALTNSWMWLVREIDSKIKKVWVIESSDIPNEYLPYPGITLIEY